jgi:uroporphyrinogen-III synthase
LDQMVTMKVAAIGPGTASAVQKSRLAVTVLPESQVAEGLVEALCTQIAGKHVLLARAAIARDVIPEALRAAGAQVDVVDAYRNVLPESAPEALRAALQQKIDAVTFTSSSSVTHLKEAAERAGIAFPFAGVPAISIGPITSATLREQGWEPAAEAKRSDIAGLAEAVQCVLRG